MTRCPAHADRNPSLGVTVKDGTILLRCYAGCDFHAVYRAANIDPKDLFPPKDRAVKSNGPGHARKIVTIYDYRDETGELLYQSLRYQPERLLPAAS